MGRQSDSSAASSCTAAEKRGRRDCHARQAGEDVVPGLSSRPTSRRARRDLPKVILFFGVYPLLRGDPASLSSFLIGENSEPTPPLLL